MLRKKKDSRKSRFTGGNHDSENGERDRPKQKRKGGERAEENLLKHQINRGRGVHRDSVDQGKRKLNLPANRRYLELKHVPRKGTSRA